MANRYNRKHGLSVSPEYTCWQHIKERCLVPTSQSYRHYGGRGVTVCALWLKFENFLADVGVRPSPEHSIERLDNNGNYEPGNVVWATQAAQTRNQRRNQFITYGGKIQTLTDWANELGLPYSTLSMRLRRGWPLEKALNPVRWSYDMRKEVV